MTSTAQAIEQAQSATAEPTPKEPKKKTGPWTDVDTLVHQGTGLAIVITKRTHGYPAYSWSIVRVEQRKDGNEHHNRFIRHSHANDWYRNNPGVTPADVVRSLIAEADTFIQVELAKDKAARPKGPRRPKGPNGSRGLSDLARADAEAKGHDHEGKTARRRRKGKGKRKSP